MPEYISKDVAFQRLLCKESEFNHWNDYNLAQCANRSGRCSSSNAYTKTW